MKTAMIWGASGGIGNAIVEKLRMEGWKNILISRSALSRDMDNELELEAELS